MFFGQCENTVFIEGPSVFLNVGKSSGHERLCVPVVTRYKESRGFLK